MSVRIRLVCMLIAGTLAAGPDALAGTQPVLREQKYDFEQIAALSKALERRLAAGRARVAIIARVGLNPDVLPPGVQFSHTAIAVYSTIRTRDGRTVPGYAIHNLYQGGERTGRSFLAQDYPVDYFAVAQRLTAGVVVPDARLQRAIMALVADGSLQGLHNPAYSVLSNPLNGMFQNCTEFVLDVVFAALYRTADRRRIKANETAWFTPHAIAVPRSRLEMAARTMPDVRIEDHADVVATTTFTSIARFLVGSGIAEDAFILEADPSTLHVSRRELVM